jgi:hypothetical protein
MSQAVVSHRLPAETWNGALSHASTGSALLDYWAKAGTYRGRDQSAVNADMKKIFADDERLALAVVFGVRLISRKPNVQGIDETQAGYGQRDEFAKALVWLQARRPEMLERNLHLIPVFGCWRDLMSEPLLSVLDREKVFALVRDNRDDALLRKYLPTIRSGSKIRSDRDRARSQWAKDLCRFLGITERDYRQLKAQGAAHVFQRQMSRNQWEQLNFNGIPGRAMMHLVSRNGKDKMTAVERHGQVERLLAWVREQPAVKFTGYPYELVRAARKRRDVVAREIFDRQFATVLEPMRDHALGNVLCALDTSGSMTMEVVPGISAYDICISLGLAFSSLNVGSFRDSVVAFGNTSQLVTLQGTFAERLRQIETMTTAWGSTNFQSVIDLLVRIRRSNPSIPVEDFPNTLLVVSDMQFNPVGGNAQTNYQAAMQKLHAAGLGSMRIIWWFVNGEAPDFPATLSDEGVYIVGGFDPTVLKALMGLKGNTDRDTPEKRKETPLEGMLNFLRQPIFGLLKVEG